jgi:hypothetical protein
LPEPRVASAYFCNSCCFVPSGIFRFGLNVLLLLLYEDGRVHMRIRVAKRCAEYTINVVYMCVCARKDIHRYTPPRTSRGNASQNSGRDVSASVGSLRNGGMYARASAEWTMNPFRLSLVWSQRNLLLTSYQDGYPGEDKGH